MNRVAVRPSRSPSSSTVSAGASRGPVSAVRLGSRPMRLLAATTMRRVRAVSLLLALAAVPVTLVLALLHPLLWPAPAIAVALLVLDLCWLRHAARSASRARIAAHVRRARLAEAPAEALVSFTPVGPANPAQPATGSSAAAAAAAAAASAPATAASAPAEVPAAGSWQPVPVPAPTYTLKARAPDRVAVGCAAAAVEPADASNRALQTLQVDGVFDQSARAEGQDTEHRDELAARRSAAG